MRASPLKRERIYRVSGPVSARTARDKLFQDFAQPVVLARLVEEIVGTDLHAAATILRRSVVAEDQNDDARRLAEALRNALRTLKP